MFARWFVQGGVPHREPFREPLWTFPKPSREGGAGPSWTPLPETVPITFFLPEICLADFSFGMFKSNRGSIGEQKLDDIDFAWHV